MVLSGCSEALQGDAVAEALGSFSSLSFAKRFHIHDLILLSDEPRGLLLPSFSGPRTHNLAVSQGVGDRRPARRLPGVRWLCQGQERVVGQHCCAVNT